MLKHVTPGLRTKIGFYLAALLIVAMILIDFVLLTSIQKWLIRARISKGFVILKTMEKLPDAKIGVENFKKNMFYGDKMDGILFDAEFVSAMVIDSGFGELLYAGNRNSELKSELFRQIRISVKDGKKRTFFTGATWGVFWKRSRYVVISSPLFEQNVVSGGAGVVMGLEGIYASLRRFQRFMLIYIFINALLLTTFGLYRLSALTVKPLHKLLRRAEEYREGQGWFVSGEEGENEFNQLSRSLNRMLGRISEDKVKLRQTVASLERANEELKKAQRDIARAEKMASVGRLSAGIAHEIGNPIGIVMGYLDLLKNEDMPQKERVEFIGRAESEINRISDIIRKLLDFSRPTDGEYKPVYVHPIIQELTEIIRYQPQMADIRIETDLHAQSDLVMADSNQLRQVFLNILLNAGDSINSGNSEKRGRIYIQSEVRKEHESEALSTGVLYLKFVDNGPGVPEENINDVFDLFFTTKEPGKGTGLGLSVSYMIIDAIGGKIEVENSSGGGFCISVQIPLVKKEQQSLNSLE